MELDLATVRALSSPTRLRILSAVLEQERTPTDLGDDLDLSKSTVSTHLSTLEEAGLVERDAEEGRRRVTYRATRAARAIVKGKERKVKFSVASSALTGVAGVALLGHRFLPFASGDAASYTAQAESLAATADTGAAAAGASQPAFPPAAAVTALGVVALLAAAGALLYALLLHRLPAGT
ncbi:MAG: winged helix-turn-helix domain-containing protein [Candidatus Nanohaloarchaea archaeon]|nr:winged helix-turn-helix domain-containing protein [Candidatus Nanohaloarchaea archaeon]